MLARHLHKLARRPVRYANMHPELAQALSNYLMIHSRAHAFPDHEYSAAHFLGLTEHPLLHQLRGGVLQGHHEAPAMYLDMLEQLVPHLQSLMSTPEHREAGVTNPVDSLVQLLDSMSGMAQNPAGASGYLPHHLQHPQAQELLRQGWRGELTGQPYSPGAFAHDLSTSQRTPTDLRGYIRAAIAGTWRDPLKRLLTVHDLARESSTRGERVVDSSGLTAGIRHVLAHHLIPHLDALGGQGMPGLAKG